MWETKTICTIWSRSRLFGWCDYEVLHFFLSIFFPSVYNYLYRYANKNRTSNTSSLHYKNIMTMAPPPVQNQAETWWVLRWHRHIRYCRIAGVSAGRFDAAAQKSTIYIFKNSPLVRERAEPLHIEYSILINKRKVSVVKKRTSRCCDDCDWSHDIRRLHLPVKLEPLEAGGLRGS